MPDYPETLKGTTIFVGAIPANYFL